ncbi:hypothetical protein [Paenibacillus sp. MMS18-CY102]|uniref:hypothetical protein n=1 Tax=Paenibacillus sp. MMS18-CY102 TaxID=2682849 RepID=UPI0013658CF3|nr:hypothetical protein [Paenibacillus sp. MMS18-CY102]MWC29564.1 hypothetical protein [Paenibacillus sp. MMS18-CY102]
MQLCAVCNGLRLLDARCLTCSAIAEDNGKASDWMGPYAPYEPIEVEYAANQQEDGASCRHVAYCPYCAITFEVAVTEGMD